MEFKFNRTKVWVRYFPRGATLPPPYNLIPNLKSVSKCMKIILNKLFKGKLNDVSTFFHNIAIIYIYIYIYIYKETHKNNK